MADSERLNPSQDAAAVFKFVAETLRPEHMRKLYEDVAPGSPIVYILYTTTDTEGERLIRFKAVDWEGVRTRKIKEIVFKVDPTDSTNYPRVCFKLSEDIVRSLEEEFGDGLGALKNKVHFGIHKAVDAGKQAAFSVIGGVTTLPPAYPLGAVKP